MRTTLLAATCALSVLLLAPTALAFSAIDRWLVTATDGFIGTPGTPVTLTWGVVADGTTIANVRPGVSQPSNLVASLDTWYGDGGGGAIQDRPWFDLLESSFQRWEETTSVRFVYEPNDSGTHSLLAGVAGVRADIRLAGTAIDSNNATLGTAAYAYAPDNGDIVLDTIDAGYFGNPANNSLRLRNTVTHEIGHSLGLAHVYSSSSTILMEPEPILNTDGPQQDDVRGIQFLYGDRLERDGGNNTLATATEIGVLPFDSVVSFGADASNSQIVQPDDTDFVSLHRTGDEDYYAFSLPNRADISVSLTPFGAFYNQRLSPSGDNENINAANLGDLAIELLLDGQVVAESSAAAAGQSESLVFSATDGGDYAIRVHGPTDSTQLYRLDISAENTLLQGDYNNDGAVDLTDYTVWRDTLGSTTDLRADGFVDGLINDFDYVSWIIGLTNAASGVAIPEPSALLLLLGVAAMRTKGP